MNETLESKAVQYVKDGNSYHSAARIYDLHPQTVKRWCERKGIRSKYVKEEVVETKTEDYVIEQSTKEELAKIVDVFDKRTEELKEQEQRIKRIIEIVAYGGMIVFLICVLLIGLRII